MDSLSLKPDLDIEVLKSILLRENYLKKLKELLHSSNVILTAKMVNTIELLRESTLQVIERIDEWELYQVSYPNVNSFMWNGKNYLEKLLYDTNELDSFNHFLDNWFGFSIKNNPFMIPFEAKLQTGEYETSYLVFGHNIKHKQDANITVERKIIQKSPYTTPIINDPEVFQHLSAKRKLDGRFRNRENNIKVPRIRDTDDLWKCYISCEVLHRISKCVEKLSSRFGSSALMYDMCKEESKSMAIRSNNLGSSKLIHDKSTNAEVHYSMLNDLNEFDRISFDEFMRTKFWTPHEVNLQKQVQRRGGELYVLNAASSKGRLQIPWRQTRYNRIKNDLMHWQNTTDLLGMTAEDAHSQISRFLFLSNDKIDGELLVRYEELYDDLMCKYSAKLNAESKLKLLIVQLKSFEEVSEYGRLTSLQAQQQIHQLPEGYSRDSDQLVSIALEDKMIRKIQVLVRKAFGRILRKAEIARREAAAIRIQTYWRLFRVGKRLKLKIYGLRLACMLQKLFRLKSAEKLRIQLYVDSLNRNSALHIQRVFRGFLGRKRLSMKREFMKALFNASESVSLAELKPGDIEEMADLVEDYMRDYTLIVPLAVLTILRGVLFLLNGDRPECVITNNGEGYIEKKYISASSSSWNSMKLILRRKGRYLRRLRSLVANSCLPNPSRLEMTIECEIHISAIYSNIVEDDFGMLTRGKKCAVQLLGYCKNIYHAYTLQKYFPEYFEPGLPFWFRKIMRIRDLLDRSHVAHLIETSSTDRIEEIKRIHSREGKKYSHISNAVSRNQMDLSNSRIHYERMTEKLDSAIQELVDNEQKQLRTLVAIVRARSLALDVSEGDLKEYLRSTFIADSTHLKDLQSKIDMKSIALMQSRTELHYYQNLIESNKYFRDFDKHLHFNTIWLYCDELGHIKGDLLVLLESWNSLLRDIGGIQYLKDLKKDKLLRFQFIQFKVSQYLTKRKQVTEQVNNELKSEYSKLYDLIRTHNIRLINKIWDDPSIAEIDFEDFENKECCKRDYESEFRKRRKLENVQIVSNIPLWHSFLIILDSKLPRDFIFKFKAHFEKNFNFAYVSLPYDASTSMYTNEIISQLQQKFDAKANVLLLYDINNLHVLNEKCDSLIQSIINVLIPSPTIVLLSGKHCYAANPWSGITSSTQFDNFVVDQQQVFVGKLFRLGVIFDSLISMREGNIDTCKKMGLQMTTTRTLQFQKDMEHFLDNIKLLQIKTKGFMIDFGSCNQCLLVDCFIAFNLAVSWNLYDVPMFHENKLESFHLFRGASFFRHFLTKINRDQFGEIFQELHFEKINRSDKRYEPASSYYIKKNYQLQAIRCAFPDIWKMTEEIDIYVSPARFWLIEYIRLVEIYFDRLSNISISAGDAREISQEIVIGEAKIFMLFPRIDEIFQYCESVPFQWSFGGDVMHLLLQKFQVFRSDQSCWKLYYNRNCLNSLLIQSLGTLVVDVCRNQEASNERNSEICIYHFDDQIFIELTLANNINLFTPTDTNCESLHSLEKLGLCKDLKNKYFRRFMMLTNVHNVVNMLQPNYSEIFEGSINSAIPTLKGADNTDCYKLFSKWLCFDVIGNSFILSLVRARYLILSNIGKISGYNLRVEVYEEKFGEILLVVFGLHDKEKDIYQVKVDRTEVYSLLKYCDEQYEREKLEAFNSLKMSYIFSNRLVVKPSRVFKEWMNSGELLPNRMFDNFNNFKIYGDSAVLLENTYNLKFRKMNGPGRLIGRKLLNLLDHFFHYDKHFSPSYIKFQDVAKTVGNFRSWFMNQYVVSLSIYEIYSENNINDLRIVMYYYHNQQTVEYRISGMERIMIFDEHYSIFPQLLQRIRLAYCDLQQESSDFHPFVKLSSNFAKFTENENYQTSQIMESFSSKEKWLKGEKYEIDGDTEFYICSLAEIELIEKVNENESVYSQNSTSTDASSSVDINTSWGWGLYFNRAPMSEQRGNITVSIQMNIGRRGFLVIAFEPRVFRESYRFFRYDEVLPFLSWSADEFQDLLSNIDESTTTEILNAIFPLVKVTFDPIEGLVLVISGNHSDNHLSIKEGGLSENILIARLVALPSSSMLKNPRSTKLYSKFSVKILIKISKIEELSRLESFGGRNAYCIVRHNLREIGRTSIRRNSLNPDWTDDKNVFEITLSKESMLNTTRIDIEVYDSDAHGETTDFLGMVTLFGLKMSEMFCSSKINHPFEDGESDAFVAFQLEKSKKLSESRNEYVKGKLFVDVRLLRFANETSAAAVNANDEISDNVSCDDQFIFKPNDDISYKYFHLYLVDIILEPSFHHSHNKNDVVQITEDSILEIVIFFNGSELYKYSVSKTNYLIDLKSSKKVTFQIDSPKPVECRIPNNFPIGGCNLRFELFLFDNQIQREKNSSKFLGYSKVDGITLKKYLKDDMSSNIVTFSNTIQSNHYSFASAGRLTTLTVIDKHAFKCYHIQINSARNLPKADLFGKSDPYVKLYFNSVFIGQTSYQSKTLNPNWLSHNEKFSLLLPLHKDIQECVLELQVYDHDKFSEHDLLGVAVITGKLLERILNSVSEDFASIQGLEEYDCEYSSNSNSFFVPLQKSTRVKHKVHPKGDIEISTVSIAESTSPFEILNPYPNNYANHCLTNEENIEHLTSEFNTVHHMEKVLFGEKRIHYKLSISQGFNLPGLSSFSNSYRFVCISVNGKVIGVSKELRNATDPKWNESFIFHLCCGQLPTFSSLVLEVFDRNGSGSDNACLGVVQLDKFDSLVSPRMDDSTSKFTKLPLESSTKFGENQAFISINLQKMSEYIEDTLILNDSTNKCGSLVIEEPVKYCGSNHEFSFILESCKIITRDISLERKENDELSFFRLVVILNGEIWFQYLGSADYKEDKILEIIWNESVNFTMALPYGVSINENVFELILHGSPHYYGRLENYDALGQFPSSETIGKWTFCGESFEKLFEETDISYPSFVEKTCLAMVNDDRIASMLLSFQLKNLPSDDSSAGYNINIYERGKHQKKFNEPIFIFSDLSDVHCPWEFYFEELEFSNSTNIDLPLKKILSPSFKPLIDKISVLDRNKYVVDPAAIDFAVTIKVSMQEGNRIFWRGKIRPKQLIFANDKIRSEVLASRASKLIEATTIESMGVYSNVHYLVDYGETIPVNEELPICVREVIMDGPGVIKRFFRVELLSNAGTVLGTADIADNEDDLLKVAGKSYPSANLISQKLISGHLSELFEYIVRERLVFDTAIREDTDIDYDESLINKPNLSSVIYFLRDDDDTHSIKNEPKSNEAESKTNFDTEETKIVLKEPLQLLHILSRNQRIVGRSFRTTVFLGSSDLSLTRNPDAFLRQYTLYDALQNLTIIIKCKDVVTKRIYELTLSGLSISFWLPAEFPFENIGTKFRRSKFATHISSYVTLKFEANECFRMEFLRFDDTKTTVKLS